MPGFLPGLPPDPGPGIHDQIACPPGSHRPLGGGINAPCVADAGRDAPPKRTEIDEGFVGPAPIPRDTIRPPKLPPGTAPPGPTLPPPPTSPGPSPADALPRSLPSQLPIPRSTRPLPTLGAVAGRLGALAWVLGTLVFSPYFLPRVPQRAQGPPRRTTRRTVTSPGDINCGPGATDPFCYMPLPRQPGGKIPERTPDAPAGSPRTGSPAGRSVPDRPRTLPGTRTPVRRVPAPTPAGWTLGDPLAGPGYDPFTYAPPTPRVATPRATPRPATRPRVGFPLPFGLPRVDPGFGTRPLTTQPRPLTPQQPARARPGVRPSPPPTLTPFNDPVPTSQPQAFRKPSSADPCTAQRTERRRRQRECKRYTTKTIRVCADK